MSYKFLNKVKFFLLLSIVILVGFGQEVSAKQTVTKIADTNDGVCDADCSLREAVAVANDDSIDFQPALAGQTIALTNGVITFSNKHLFIMGLDGLSVSGEDLSRVFHITDESTIAIHNLIIKNGFAQYPDVLGFTGDGGAILVQNGSALNLGNSRINTSEAITGGAIAVFDSLLSVGGGTIISGNKAAICGGAIYAEGTNAEVRIISSTIKSNQAVFRGGALCQSNGKLRVTNSEIYQNTASSGNTGRGGAMYLTGYSFVASSFGTDFVIKDSSIYNNTAGHGGGIYNHGNLTLINSTLSGNYALLGDGGALLHLASGGPLQGILNIRNSTIALNSAIGAGGGIFKLGDAGEINFGNTIIAGNTSVTTTAANIKGTVNSLGHNFIGTTGGAVILGDLSGNQINPDPKLAPLAYNGGITINHIPKTGSPVVNAGSNALAVDANGNPLVTDQRGKNRFYGTIDIGAVEQGPVRAQ